MYFTYQDEKKRIWVGTLDGGLNLLCEENGEVTFKNSEKLFRQICVSITRNIFMMTYLWLKNRSKTNS